MAMGLILAQLLKRLGCRVTIQHLCSEHWIRIRDFCGLCHVCLDGLSDDPSDRFQKLFDKAMRIWESVALGDPPVDSSDSKRQRTAK